MQDSPKQNRLLEALMKVNKHPLEGEHQATLKEAQKEAWKINTQFQEKKISIIEIIVDLAMYKQLALFRKKRLEELAQELEGAKYKLNRENFRRLKTAIKAALISGKNRSDAKGKDEAYAAWSAWQRDPNKKPYGDMRGCNKAFDFDMTGRYGMELETISKWRQAWQKGQHI